MSRGWVSAIGALGVLLGMAWGLATALLVLDGGLVLGISGFGVAAGLGGWRFSPGLRFCRILWGLCVALGALGLILGGMDRFL